MKETGACIYCGQIATVTVPEDATEEQINQAATRQCNCNEAVQENRLTASIDAAGVDIDDLFAEWPAMQKLLNESVEPVARGGIAKITIQQGKIKAAISKNGKGEIKVERIKTFKEEWVN